MYERIVVAVDGSATSAMALNEAISLAKLTHAKMLLLHVCEEMPLAWSMDGITSVPMVDMGKAFVEAGKQVLRKDQVLAEQSGISIETKLVEDYSGRVGVVVASEAKNWSADLLGVGSHGRKGLDHFLMGSVAESVMRSATMPVLLVRGK